MSAIFISDLHLSPERPEVSRAFFDFIHTTLGTDDELYILGDLVEAWIGDDDPHPLTLEIIGELRKLSATGTRIYFLAGNRDFLIGQTFARKTCIQLLGNVHLIRESRSRVLVCHGDTLCSEDRSYQRYRRFIRNPATRWLLRNLPLNIRQSLAQKMRRKSLEANSNKPENIMDVNSQAVAELMEAYRADILIHGHTHRPAIHHLANDKERVVLGDWSDLYWYAKLEDGSVTLHQGPIP